MRERRQGDTRSERAPKGSGAGRVYDEIRERILNLELEPGADLDEGALERLLGVSRTPVREALIRLSSEGLVRHEPNRGASVASIGLDTVRQFFEALDLTQRAVTRWAALRRSKEQVAVIHSLRDGFERAVRGGDARIMNDANSRFHVAISAACGNLYLKSSYERLFAEGLRLARLTLAYSSPDGSSPKAHLERIVAEHRGMADAIADGDADGAERLALDHANLFRSRIDDYLSHNLSRGLTILPPNGRASGASAHADQG
jgi:DNA-binding GntR family transcriptional regulator